MSRWLGLALVLISTSSFAASQTRCQCEYNNWVGDCQTQIKRSGDAVRITSNTQQCSRVDWNINGQPHVTIVTDGSETVDLFNISSDARIEIQSCKICRDEMVGDNSNTWTVRIAILSNQQHASKFSNDIGGMGYDAYTAQSILNGKQVHLVCIGHGLDRSSAEAIVRRLASGRPKFSSSVEPRCE